LIFEHEHIIQSCESYMGSAVIALIGDVRSVIGVRKGINKVQKRKHSKVKYT